MKIFKDNPILLIWLVLITALVIFSFFRVKITVHLDTPEKSQIQMKTRTHFPQIGVHNE